MVVGSGFGGAVIAYRLAEAGLSVCVVERGKPYPPGSFPRTPVELGTSFWNPAERSYGLFDLRSFRGRLVTLVGSGLGGGSLIYAGVLLRKDERWFVQAEAGESGSEHWPVTRADLDPHYERVERMLGAQCYPFETHAPYRETPKTRQLKLAAEELGLAWQLPNLGLTFANAGCEPEVGVPIDGTGNLHDTPRFTCRLCGECNLGCNAGSKNSLDLTYLSEAWRHGAEIRTLCEVRAIAPRPGRGYAVRYVEHGQTGADASLVVEVTADTLVLAAGTLGTTQLLLRNRRSFPRLSAMLGRRFSANGDRLTFAVKARDHRGGGQRASAFRPSFGPVITGAIRVPDAADEGAGRGFYVEDAGYPAFLADWAGAALRPTLRARLLRFAGRRAWSRMAAARFPGLGGAIGAALRSGILSDDALPLVGMGRDVPDGVISLRDGCLDVEWPTGSSEEYAARLRDTLRAIAGVWQAEFLDDPLGRGGGAITVHPLGGCPMGRHPGEGVVDADGQVFGYPGLYVADGSVMPGPVGPNPALTIAALADRFADRMVECAPSVRRDRWAAPVPVGPLLVGVAGPQDGAVLQLPPDDL